MYMSILGGMLRISGLPNLSRIGLLTDSVKEKFDDLGILEFASLPSDGDIDWADLSRPLFEESA